MLFTAPGFTKPGVAKWDGDPTWSSGGRTGEVEIRVLDAATAKPTPCRMNVVGRDGNFYQPAQNRLSRFALTGDWPAPGAWGNRKGKAPFRYVGRFFYTTGETLVRVPAGTVRVEVWKGLEYRPAMVNVEVGPGTLKRIEIKLERAANMAAEGFYAGDTHLHFQRWNPEDDDLIFDLLDAEMLTCGVALGYNNPAGPYLGFMDKLVFPQRKLGRASLASRGVTRLVSGQEYRSTTYGHMNLILRDDLVSAGKDYNSDTWPVYGEVARETVSKGGFALMAHGGYGQEIYADAALGTVQSVELLQFGIYRDIGLEGWYAMLNSGFRFPAHGASDFPPCRTLADCRTYVQSATAPTMQEWLTGLVEGRSFMTTAPLLLLDVDGKTPGAQIRKAGTGPKTVKARVRVRCEVTPVTDLDLIVNGKVVKHLAIPRDTGMGRWIELAEDVVLDGSAWIAARAYSTSPGGLPDAEAHTNPVYVYLNNRTPFQKAAVDYWIAKIDGQIAAHAKRVFPDNAKVLNYFQQARDVLLKVRAQGGLSADADPRKLSVAAAETPPGLRNLALDGSLADVTGEEIKAYLKTVAVPPPSPEQALAAFETLDGFRMELVAAEPQVRSPIVAAFDADGAMFVGEMTDYPYNPGHRVQVAWQREQPPGAKPEGAVRLLRDLDGDGRYEKSTVFADHLLWPGGIAPWKGGVFVTAPPDIWYLKDTDGDDVADVREKVFTGFDMQRQQGFVNSLVFSLDHQIHACTGTSGGELRPGDDPKAKPLIIGDRDLSFDPVTRRAELQTGGKQFGVAFDDWGHRFICDQGNPGFHVVLPLRYLERHPHFTARETILRMAPSSSPVFRISPLEGWRHIKSSRRVAGMERTADIVPIIGQASAGAQPVAEGARAASGAGVSHYTIDANAGVTVYRGGAYPAAFRGSLFSGDSVGNLVHRRVPVSEGAALRSERADAGTEFVRSSDPWFRPVNFANAPDGTLYCVDMAREYSESVNIPADVEKQMDLQSGKERGRIYRIAPVGFKQPPPPRLSKATTAELVAALESPHGWWRDTAHRLLFEKQDASAVPALEKLVRDSKSPQARLHALWSLHGLAALSDDMILLGLGDTQDGVRENAVRLAEPRLDAAPAIRERVLALVSDPEPRVRLQVAFTLGQSRQCDQPALLARMARENAADKWIPSALLSSSADCGGALLALLAGDKTTIEFQRQLATAIGFQNRAADVAQSIAKLAALPDSATALSLLRALGEGLKLAGTTLAAADREGKTAPVLQLAPAIALDAKRPETERHAAVEILSLTSFEVARPALEASLAKGQASARQLAAIQVLRQFSDPRVGPLLLAHYGGLPASLKTPALDALIERSDRAALLLDSLQNQTLARTDLTAAQIAALRQQADEKLRERVTEVFGVSNNARRGEVYRSFLPALDLAGDAGRGQPIFQSRCAACHRFKSIGLAFGPDLSGVATGGKDKLLTAILDPNRDVAPEFFFHSLVTQSGESVAGVRQNETATALTLLQVGGIAKTVAKDQIASAKILRQSLMPDGLEGGLTHQDMADLIAFLTKS